MIICFGMAHASKMTREAGNRLRRSLGLAGIPHKDAADRVGMDEPEFSKCLNERGISDALLLRIAYEVPPCDEYPGGLFYPDGREFLIAFATVTKRMAKAESPLRAVEARLARMERGLDELVRIMAIRKTRRENA